MGFLGKMIGTTAKVTAGAIGTTFTATNNLGKQIQMNSQIKKTVRNYAETNLQRRNVVVAASINKFSIFPPIAQRAGEIDDIYGQVKCEDPGLNFIWGESDALESYVVSGATDIIRSNALVPFLRKAANAETSVIALHCGNRKIESIVQSEFGGSKGGAEIVSATASYYDPLHSLPSDDIARLLYDSAPQNAALRPQAETLIRLTADMIESGGGTVSFNELANCRVENTANTIQDLFSHGYIDLSEKTRFEHEYAGVSTESTSVNAYFSRLNSEFTRVNGRVSSGRAACNVKKILRQGGAIAIDVGISNDLVINVVVKHLEYMRNFGLNFALVIGDVALRDNTVLQNLLRYSDFALSYNDFISEVSGGMANDGLFSNIVGNARKIVLFEHRSGFSCSKWSEHLGKYKKIKADFSIGQSSSWGSVTNTHGMSSNESDEFRIPAEALSRLSGEIACISDGTDILIAEVPKHA